ncbi:response regulator [Janibacter sp. GXQ6167]|uniref:response regulator transcription factor n=1 Tax=Janibacter sp. GXQ6167 TaxID=3240791 RepID=UPI0035252A0E
MTGTPDAGPIRVLLCDDDPMVLQGLRLLLEPAPDIEVIDEATSGEEAIDKCIARSPDVVLMDLRMGGMSGIEATKRIKALPRSPQVLVLTTFDTDEVAVRALQSGADGFLLKTSPKRIAESIRSVAAGDGAFSPKTSRQLAEHIRSGYSPAQARARQLVAALTERERAVVMRVGEGMTNSEIARALHIGEATVKTHLAAAQGKLLANNRSQVAVIAERAGLLA